MNKEESLAYLQDRIDKVKNATEKDIQFYKEVYDKENLDMGGEYIAHKSKEDVIKALKICSDTNCFDCKGCPYQNYKPDVFHCSDRVMIDAAEYLSQE